MMRNWKEMDIRGKMLVRTRESARKSKEGLTDDMSSATSLMNVGTDLCHKKECNSSFTYGVV